MTFFIWTHHEDKLEEFPDNFNKVHPNLSFTHEYSEKNVTFLDLDLNIVDRKIATNLHFKATEKHTTISISILHYIS